MIFGEWEKNHGVVSELERILKGSQFLNYSYLSILLCKTHQNTFWIIQCKFVRQGISLLLENDKLF